MGVCGFASFTECVVSVLKYKSNVEVGIRFPYSEVFGAVTRYPVSFALDDDAVRHYKVGSINALPNIL
jgi:hypothetical protein